MGDVDRPWFKIANVDIEDSTQFMACPTLWVRCGAGSRLPAKNRTAGRHAFTLPADGDYDFLTYYGSLSLRKWDGYTTARAYALDVLGVGKYDVTFEYADAYAYPSTVQDGPSFSFDDAKETLHRLDPGIGSNLAQGDAAVEEGTGAVASDPTTSECDGAAPADAASADAAPAMRRNAHGVLPVLVGFHIHTHGDCAFRSVNWQALATVTQDVKLAICTTTFKKERYIERNVRAIRDTILAQSNARDDAHRADTHDLVGDHFVMNVVDNGRTLDAGKLEGGGIRVFPNPNAGGAGGFARGMIESMGEGVTHAIMMDDDVSFCPEAFVRTYNLLSIVKDEYRDAFVSGGMMSMYDVDIQTEDTGFMTYGGACQATKPPLRLSLVHEIVHNETFEPPAYRPECHDTFQRYAAWWYCAIPMTQIRKRGLPLPLFVRYDDVGYALRDNDDATRRFMTMNGICVWHEPFFMRYDGAVERYQTTRNSLIIRAASDAAPMSDFKQMITHTFKLELKRLNYDDAQLICEGIEDYLQGPDVTFAPGFAERRFLQTHKSCEKCVSFDEARDALRELGIDIDDVEPVDVFHDYDRSRSERMVDLVTYLGHDVIHRGRDAAESGAPAAGAGTDARVQKVAIMSRDGGAYQPGEIRNADVIVAVDVPNHKVAIRRRDNARFHALMDRFKNDMRQVESRQTELREAYHVAADYMHTRGAWEHYLGLGAR